MPKSSNRKSGAGKRGTKQGKLLKLSTKNPVWSHDSALLERSFPDTQIWNTLSEHVPRYGQVNSKDNKIYNFSQSNVIRNWMVWSSTTVGVANYYANLASFAQASTYAALFDQWRIHQIEVWMVPSTTAQAGTNSERVYTVIDYDDANNLANESAAQQYTNVTISAPNEGVYRRFQPHIALGAYSGTFASFANEKNVWIDVGSPSVQHYGFKSLVQSSGNTSGAFDLEIRLWGQFRNVF